MANSPGNFYTFLALNIVLILIVTVIVSLNVFSPFGYSFSLNSTNANTITKNIDSSTISLNKTDSLVNSTYDRRNEKYQCH